jgi:hypothetical protein
MDFESGLNSPLAVVAILSAVFGFVMMGIDKLTYFLKSVNKATPMDKLSGSYSTMVKMAEEQTKVLTLLAQKMEHHEEMAQLRHEQLLREVGRK